MRIAHTQKKYLDRPVHYFLVILQNLIDPGILLNGIFVVRINWLRAHATHVVQQGSQISLLQRRGRNVSKTRLKGCGCPEKRLGA